MKKRDWIVAAVFLIVALWIWFFSKEMSGTGEVLKISVDGEVYGEYALDTEQEIAIGTTNRCQIKNGKVRMIQGDCPDKICVHTVEISKIGETIVCLPNRVILEIVSDS